MTIVDVPRVITVEVTEVATEGGATGTFTFNRTGPTTEALTVFFTLGGTATLSTDYSLNPLGSTSVTFPGGQADPTSVVKAQSEDPVGRDNTDKETLTTCGPYTIGSPNAATVTIVDATPVITVEATDAIATEGGDTGTFTFSRTGPTSEALTVSFTTGGTATLTTDYSLSPLGVTSVTFAGGQATATKTVTALNDAPIDPDETVIVTLATGGPYAIGSPNAATVTIIDAAGGQSLTDRWGGTTAQGQFATVDVGGDTNHASLSVPTVHVRSLFWNSNHSES